MISDVFRCPLHGSFDTISLADFLFVLHGYMIDGFALGIGWETVSHDCIVLLLCPANHPCRYIL
jgi:hypothetical protein